MIKYIYAFLAVCFLIELGWSRKIKTKTSDRADSKSDRNELINEVLDCHNKYRERHRAPPLTLSPQMCKVSQKYAEHLARTGKLQHSQSPYGENLFWSSGGVKGTAACDSWYSEIQYYDYNSPKFNSQSGHFTQMIWKNSENLGVGIARSHHGGTYVVCNYDPPGNFMGEYQKNVLPKN